MQFDVHANPVKSARRVYPWVVELQSPVADAGRTRVVAPLVPRDALGSETTGRLVPIVQVHGTEHVVLVPSLASVPACDLGPPVGSAVYARAELLAAVDLLFFGV
jgi:toxin CcdB